MAAMSLENAKEAVENQMQATAFIETHANAILEKLEECDRRVSGPPEQEPAEGEDVLFIAECLPIMAGIVHLSSSLETYRAAKAWAKKLLPEADPGFVLSTFLFLYLVDLGRVASAGDPKKAAVWDRIHDRVQHFVQPGKPPEGEAARVA